MNKLYARFTFDVIDTMSNIHIVFPRENKRSKSMQIIKNIGDGGHLWSYY